jgi:hypothetical protein
MSSIGAISRKRRQKSASPRSKGYAKPGSKTLRLNDDWREFLLALISTGTRFLLIGGHAIAVYAEPRFTEDLDVFVEPHSENARRLRAALDEFGFGSVAPPVSALARKGRVWAPLTASRSPCLEITPRSASRAKALRRTFRVEVRAMGIRSMLVLSAALEAFARKGAAACAKTAAGCTFCAIDTKSSSNDAGTGDAVEPARSSTCRQLVKPSLRKSRLRRERSDSGQPCSPRSSASPTTLVS